MGLPLAIIGAIYMMIFAYPCLYGKKKKTNSSGSQYMELGDENASTGHSNGYWVVVEIVNLKNKTPTQVGLHNVLLSELVCLMRNEGQDSFKGE